MRRFNRLVYEIPTLAPHGPAGKTRQEHIDRYNQDGTMPGKFPGHWSQPDVWGFLLAMQHRICAYCGMATNGLDVEHFRPKGKIQGDSDHRGYWWLAYDPGNLLLACTVCNSRRKKSFFPLEAGAPRITWETRSNIREERRVLLDPSEDAIEELFEVDWDAPVCRLIPRTSLSAIDRDRVQSVIDLFRLNIDPEIRKERSKVYKDALLSEKAGDWNRLRSLAMRHNDIASRRGWFFETMRHTSCRDRKMNYEIGSRCFGWTS